MNQIKLTFSPQIKWWYEDPIIAVISATFEFEFWNQIKSWKKKLLLKVN